MKYILGVYSQIPQGSEEKQKESLLNEQLKPLLTMLYQNPKYKLMLRLGISYFDWIESNHPEINMLINDLCSKNQIELLASSYFDAIIPLVPPAERSLHFDRAVTYLRKKFHKKIRGVWFNHQFFAPTAISAIEQCGLEYAVISSYNQSQNSVLFNKPFFISEMGKETLVFPYEDKYSKILFDCSKNGENSHKLVSEMLKAAESYSSGLNLIMLNLDQMVLIRNSSELYQKLYDFLGPNSTICSEYSDNHEILKEYYYPQGLYGRDISMTKANSINQLILDVPVLNRYSRLLNIFRDSIRDIKKNSDTRRNTEQILLKASDSSMFINGNYLNPAIRLSCSKPLCEAEAILNSIGILPSKADINGDRIGEFTAIQKGSVAYLNTKGGVICRLNLIPCLFDVCFNNGDGLFSDSLRNISTGKVTDLSSKRYEITPLGNKGLEYYVKSPTVDLNKTQITVSKHYKFRQNTIIVEIEIENLTDSNLKDCSYECYFDFNLTNRTVLEGSNNEVKSISAKNGLKPYSVSAYFSEPVNTSIRDIVNSSDNKKESLYQYTQLKVQKKLNLSASEVARLTITLKLEKTK